VKPAPISPVRFEVDGAVARITLDRSEQHNALRAEDVTRLHTLFDRVEADSFVRVLVVTGSGDRTFCSGASLEQMESGEMSGRIFDSLTDRLARLTTPTICMLNGSVYGGGAELALCCDFRLGTPEVRLSVPAALLGVCYPVGGLGRYVRRVGLPAATRILLAAEELEGAELRRIGYLTHLVERDFLASTTRSLAARLAALAPLAIRNMKALMLDIAEGSIDAAAADRRIDECMASEDLREGLAARREKREPDFRGR
jgi:enoyl-CoA hydratase/carnithine racemase